MMFEYCAELKDGYKPTMETETGNTVYFQIDAKNRVTADRMVKAMLTVGNITEISGVAID